MRRHLNDWRSFSVNEARAKKSYSKEETEAYNDGWNVGFEEAKQMYVKMIQDLLKNAKSKDAGDVM